MKSVSEPLRSVPEKHRDIIRFYFFKNLPYSRRMPLAFLLLFAGLALQIMALNPWIGVPFLAGAVMLALVKGYDSRVRLENFRPDAAWTRVSIKDIDKLEALRKRTREWDRDFLDISNTLGFATFLAVLVLGYFGSAFLGKVTGAPETVMIIRVDIVILFVPFWLTGMKFILKQPNLAIKVRLIQRLYRGFRRMGKPGEVFQPELKLARDASGKTIPVDARFTVRFEGAPETFYGVQAQININLVQGNSYPYFYCVIAAKPGMNLDKYRPSLVLLGNTICEYQKDARAEVLVIRQRTTKTSGYHTRISDCENILATALQGARTVLEDIMPRNEV